MKKLILIFVFAVFAIPYVHAQSPLTTAVFDFQYKFVSADGTNASGVVYHPVKKLYFTFIAGNPEFPFEAFNSDGMNVYEGLTGIDARGFWFNPKSKSLEANCAGDEGWVKIKLFGDIESHSIKYIHQSANQPEFNSCGTYCPEKKSVVFFNADTKSFDFYNYKKPSKISSVSVGITFDKVYEVNTTTIAYTGKSGYELVMLDYIDGKLLFFNLSGDKTGETKLPSLAPLPDSFRFAFTNDRVFLFDTEERVWMAFRTF